MKLSRTLLLFSALFVMCLTLYVSLSSPLICEPPSDREYDQDNLFWSIRQRSAGVWDVFFKNVRLHYQVTMSDRTQLGDFDRNNFHMRQSGADTAPSEIVQMTRINRTVVDAVMDHFNDIQRGNVHTHLPNYINPNAHGRVGRIPGYTSNLDINSPLDQFVIKEFITLLINIGTNIRFTFTNMAFYLSLSSYIVLVMHLLYNKAKGLLSNLWSLNRESLYSTIHGIVLNQISVIKGQKFLPFVYTLFIYIFINNLIGMIPYNFSATSHFILTFFISFTVVLGASILGILLKKLAFFTILVPEGCPIGLLPLLVLIESVSYLARNVSLGLRLAANILSGHMLLNILSGFTYNIIIAGVVGLILGLIPLIFISAFSTLELGICFIQSQVFCVLSSSYIKDGV